MPFSCKFPFMHKGPTCAPASQPVLFCISPSGWDNEKKIAILHENFQTLKSDDIFEDVIVKPPVRKVRVLQGRVLSEALFDERAAKVNVPSPACHQIVHEKEIQAEDDQVFLVKLQVRRSSHFLVSVSFPLPFKSVLKVWIC